MSSKGKTAAKKRATQKARQRYQSLKGGLLSPLEGELFMQRFRRDVKAGKVADLFPELR